MNVTKCLDKATPPSFNGGKHRGLLSLTPHSMKVLKFRYQQAAPHAFKVGNIYVGRTLNVSRVVGSELKMANFTLVERRMTKVKSPFCSLGIQNDEFYFGRSANDQSKIAFLAAATLMNLAIVAHMRQTTTQINSTLTIWPPRPESSIHSSFDQSKMRSSSGIRRPPRGPFCSPSKPPIAYAS